MRLDRLRQKPGMAQTLGYDGDAARAPFAEVYGYWTTLPRDHRPKLYLHGLSLGAMNSEQSNELFEVLGDPYQGELWSGPPYSSLPICAGIGS